LITGRVAVERTPILRAPDLSWPFKFLMIPNHDRTRVLEASVAMDFVGDTLNNAIKPDKNIVSIGLFTPNGNVLGYVHSEGVKPPVSGPLDASSVVFGAPRLTKSGYVFFSKMAATVEDCCECRTKGLTLPDGKYYYVLKMEVSRASLDAKIASIRRWFLLIGLLALILSGAMAYLISRHLVQRLISIGERVKEIARSGRWDLRLGVQGRDEIGVLAEKFDDMLERLSSSQAELASAEREKALVELARQVAHDIRSPLAALDSVVGKIAQIPEDDRILIRSAVNRIKDIANDLLETNRRQRPASSMDASAADPAGVQLLSSLIDPLITEKRMQFRSRIGVSINSRIDSESYGLFAQVRPREFKRVLSNLINNGVEALGEKGTVWVSLSADPGTLRLEVRDSGKGIPPEILATLGRRDETYGKSEGSGLGLFHARKAAEAWGGSLELRSEPGRGTSVVLTIPRARTPEWFVAVLELDPRATVVVLDDDTSIHQVWQGRLESLQSKGAIFRTCHFSSPTELRKWVQDDPGRARDAVYLVDYELLGDRETGLSLIAELELGRQAILVTSRFEERAILEECVRLGARMIPKGLAGFVPIHVKPAKVEGPSSPGGSLDAVLIDDDPLTRAVWNAAAKKAGKSFRSYADAGSFLADLENAAIIVPRDAALYLDSNLGDGVRGEDVAKQLHAREFTNIRLATGYLPAEFPPSPAIREVVGKEPPWV
jgi:signal transduction histidine kinase